MRFTYVIGACKGTSLKAWHNCQGNSGFKKTVLKAHFQQFMTVFGDCLKCKTMLKNKNQEKPGKLYIMKSSF